MDTNQIVLSAVVLLSLLGLWRWRAPILWLPIFVSISLLFGEFYPFSDFPMYSDPNESENYIYVEEVKSDGNRSPIAINEVIGITAPKIKKMYKARLSERADEMGISKNELTKQDKGAIGEELINYLRNLKDSRETSDPLPSRLALVDYWITAKPEGGFLETPTVLFSE